MSATPSPPDPGAYQDPLENFEPKQYDDPLEQALEEETVAAIQSTPYASVPADTTVEQAVRQLADLQVACLLVAQDNKLVGVFSHRDALDKVALEYDAVKDQPVSTVMTTDPVYAFATDSSAAALAVMAVSGHRHVPILDGDETIMGIASPQRVTEFLQRYLGN